MKNFAQEFNEVKETYTGRVSINMNCNQQSIIRERKEGKTKKSAGMAASHRDENHRRFAFLCDDDRLVGVILSIKYV